MVRGRDKAKGNVRVGGIGLPVDLAVSAGSAPLDIGRLLRFGILKTRSLIFLLVYGCLGFVDCFYSVFRRRGPYCCSLCGLQPGGLFVV